MPKTARKLGRYELREPIGRGGMSAVYLGYDPMLDREVAIKILPPNLAKKPVYQKRFLEEARALGRVDHHNLIRVYAVGQEGATSYYAMELVRGISLHDAIQTSGRLDANETLAIFGQFLLGLQAIHQAGIVHRDIKPGNIMLSETGRVILMDFGLARRADRQAITVTGCVLGTPEYMSPEQARGEQTNARSDLYSAGIVLYQMLCGQAPFRGKDTLAILRRHVEAPVPPMPKSVRGVPPELEKILQHLLEKKPEQRPANAAAASNALGALLPDTRAAEQIVRALVAATQKQIQRKPTTPEPPPPRADDKSPAKTTPPARPQSTSWVPWGAMATAVLAVLVAILALIEPSAPPAGEIWRTIALRNGASFRGKLARLAPLPEGDMSMEFHLENETAKKINASQIRRMKQWRPLPWVQLSAALVAAVALAVALIVLIQSRKVAKT